MTDTFIGKYSTEGNFDWVCQFGSGEDEGCESVTADYLGNIYIAGRTWGSLEGSNAGECDAFITKLDSAGVRLWTRQLGSDEQDSASAISADKLGNVYVTGYTEGSIDGTSAGLTDVFISKFNPDGDLEWIDQLGTNAMEKSLDIAIDGMGCAYISGWSSGSFGGPKPGASDAFVAKYDPTGNLLWTQLVGSSKSDVAESITVDLLGNVYLCGWTTGALEGVSVGEHDAFIAKLVIPEPGTVLLLGFGGVGLAGWRKRVRVCGHK